nr:hypothetical protein [Tanacetum cinerariifolium]
MISISQLPPPLQQRPKRIKEAGLIAPTKGAFGVSVRHQ